MIQRLRRKFILINMLLVTGVLLIVFGALCFSTYQRISRQSFDAMRQAVERSGKAPPKFELGGPQRERPPAMLPVLCALVDADGSVLRITGGDSVAISDELLSRAVAEALASPENRGILHTADLRFYRQETPGGIKIALADRSSEHSAVKSFVGASLLVGAGGLAAFFFISLFLSAWALRPVQDAWNQQRQFVADASHELKTPLTVILANTGILLSHQNDTIQAQSKWVSNIKAESESMKKLVDDLLFLAKSDAARRTQDILPLNLSDAVWSVLLPFEPVAFEQGVMLQSEVAPGLMLSGEESRLRQLVAILLDNACKYAGPGGHVTLLLEKVQDKAKLRVINTGEPIAPEHLPHLFERFYRSDASRARTQGGYGLGLAIAKSIVEGHHGKISVTSSARDGTRFTVMLPLK